MWPYYSLLASGGSPLGSATGDIVNYILSYGILGVFTIAAGIVLYKGLMIPATKAKEDLADAVALARTDLLAENERLRDALSKAENQRDDALRVARDQIVPLLTTFNTTVSALLPVLQDAVRKLEDSTPRRQNRP